MHNIKFIKNPGYVFDLFFLFTLYFNKEYCLTNFINYSKSNQDTTYFNKLLDDFPPISNELILFFYLTDDKKNFMSKFYFEPYKENFLNESYTLSFVQDRLADIEKVKENILKCYFSDISKSDLLECKTSISAVNRLIKGSNYNGEIKSALYSFFIDPVPIIRRLSYELMEKDFALKQLYDNNHKNVIEAQDNLDYESLCNGLRNIRNQNMEIDCFEDVCISFCVCNKNLIKLCFCANTVFILLGCDYIDCIHFLAIQNKLPELEVFGNAISEPNRIGILDLIMRKSEITIKDLEQEFGFTGTNAYYHLSLMIKAGMLKTRNRGRTVLYSINKKYFQALCDVLKKYYKDEGVSQ